MRGTELFSAGFRHLVSVVPPDAELTPDTKLQHKDRGKSPGTRRENGLWGGYPWLKTEVTAPLVAYWEQSGASFGLAGAYYPGIDIDVMVPEVAAACRAAVLALLPGAPVRIGREPKSMVMLRSEEPLRSFDMRYEHPTNGPELIQFVASGRHYVVSGIHPDTRKPYRIEPEEGLRLLGPDALPTVDADTIHRVFDALTAVMEEFGYTAKNTAAANARHTSTNQEDLVAPSLEALTDVMSQLPNTVETREDWIAVAYAIKASWPEDEEAAFEAFAEWCERWDGGYNDPDTVRREWDKMRPPYHRGFGWIQGEAAKHGVYSAPYEWEAAANPAAPSFASSIDSLFGPQPMDPDDAAIAAFNERKAKRMESEDGAYVPWSDKALADECRHLVDDYILKSASQGEYLRWNGHMWVVRGSKQKLWASIDRFLRKKTAEAAESLEGKTQREMMVRLGSSGLHTTLTKLLVDQMEDDISLLNKDPDYLNTPEGPYDLRTGQLLAPDRSMFMSKCTTVAPDFRGKATRWEQFIAESTGGNEELATWLKRYAGYSLTGHVREQIFPMFIGPGGNGKSVFTKVITTIMGEYAKTADVRLFQSRKVGASDIDPQREMAHLHGARLVLTSETRSGGYWDELRVKQLTGDDRIEAREIYEKKFEYEATFSLLIVGNYAPEMNTVGESMQRRMRLVPWENRPAAKDKALSEKLLAEAPAILAWMIEGAIDWYANGLNEVDVITEKTRTYLEGEDVVSQWAGQLQYGPGRKASLLTMYQDYVRFCMEQHVGHAGKQKFRRQAEDALNRRNVCQEGSAGNPIFIGCQPVAGASPNADGGGFEASNPHK